MNISEIKQVMREQSNASMLYLLPPRLRQLLLDGVLGCKLSMGADGNVVFTEPNGNQTSLSTTYKDAEAKMHIMKKHGVA